MYSVKRTSYNIGFRVDQNRCTIIGLHSATCDTPLNICSVYFSTHSVCFFFFPLVVAWSKRNTKSHTVLSFPLKPHNNAPNSPFRSWSISQHFSKHKSRIWKFPLCFCAPHLLPPLLHNHAPSSRRPHLSQHQSSKPNSDVPFDPFYLVYEYTALNSTDTTPMSV